MKKEWGEQQIRDYLLGYLPENETEHLDELRIANDEFAFRLLAIENDLLDAYLKGELSEPDLLKFETRYLGYPPRRKKIRIAKVFHSLLAKEKKTELPALSQRNYALRYSPWLAAAAILLLTLSTYLAFQNIRMRNDMDEQQAELKALRVRELVLQKETRSSKELKPEKLIAMNLSPATRGISKIPILEIPVGTVSALFTMQLETGRFARYQVELRDPSTHDLLWRSETVKAGKTIQIKVPAEALSTQHYQFELYGVLVNGATEFAAGYPLTVIRK